MKAAAAKACAGAGVSFTVVMAEQRSPEWFAARLGRLTGSRAADMLATIKSGEAAARRDLRVQLVVERLTSTLQEERSSTRRCSAGSTASRWPSPPTSP
jgi:hypothetical protein